MWVFWGDYYDEKWKTHKKVFLIPQFIKLKRFNISIIIKMSIENKIPKPIYKKIIQFSAWFCYKSDLTWSGFK